MATSPHRRRTRSRSASAPPPAFPVSAFAFSACSPGPSAPRLPPATGSAGGFLVGDAAARTTPRRATGMNTGLAAAHNLAWKLAWVLRGWAGKALLDTYEQ